jgi:DNA-binding beta-propeller fold protein YncE
MQVKGNQMKLGISTITLSMLLLFQQARADDKHIQNGSLLGQFSTSSERIVSTVPSNGDQNPYGVAFVPDLIAPGGLLQPGDILVSNFNGSGGVQGTGTTIVRISKTGQASVFFQGNPGLGLTTALGVLSRGFVLVGNVPTTDGTAGTIQPTSLLVIDKNGKLVATLSDPKLLAGPWDLTVVDEGLFAQIFVSNVLSGTVTRLDVSMGFNGGFRGDTLTVNSKTQIASGYLHAPNMAAVVVGPTGLAFDPLRNLLYVASTGDNQIFAVPNPLFTNKDNGTGQLIYQDNTHLHGPLGLALAPNGHLITANGDAINAGPAGTQNLLVEFTPAGQFVSQFQVDPGPAGAAFGLAIQVGFEGIRLATVDDNANTLEIFQLPLIL